MNSTSACPLGHGTGAVSEKESQQISASTQSASSSECPMGHGASSKAAHVPAQSKPDEQPLSGDRAVSTIPSATGDPFLYPSEKQFFGSAVAKGHDVQAQDMSMVVAIHNAVNERTWQEILLYERLHAEECATPRLIRFLGRPGELSPKAKFLGLFGRTVPFDRHDWHVDRCGNQVRYLVDFYDGKASKDHPVSIHIDARPEVSFGGIRDRLQLWLTGSRLS